MQLTIIHTHPNGTLIEGTTKNDGANTVLKRHRWRWGRSIAAWYLPHSRDKNAQMHRINATGQALEAAGFTVELDIDNTPRKTADIEADKAARAKSRADALAAKADRKKANYAAARAARDTALERLPYGGEPIKIGHHSERRHRNDLQRAHNAMGKAAGAGHTAAEAQRKATTASATTDARYAPSTVGNRIERLEAEARKIQRHLNGYTAQQGTPYAHDVPPATGAGRDHWNAEAARVADELAYWQNIRTEQIDAGQVDEYGPDNINAGDYVRAGRARSWWRVKRVNKKTVTLVSGPSEIREPYQALTGHTPAQ